MKLLFFVFTGFLFFTTELFAQTEEINEKAPPSLELMVPSTKSKLYYAGTKQLRIEINTENRGWKPYKLNNGCWYVNLKTCGKGPNEICSKRIRVSTISRINYSEITTLEPKCRYRIEYSEEEKGYTILKISE